VWFDDRLHRQQLVVPDGCIDIVWIRGRPPGVAGPATLPVLADLAVGEPVLGLRFRPGHAPAWLGLPAHQLLNADVPLRELWGDAAARLHEELEASTSITEALTTLQRAVEQQRQRAADDLVAEAVRHLRREPQTHVRELGDRLGISERQLLRRFTEAVGYGPKVLGRVLRFQRFMKLLWEPRTQAWDLARMAAEAGYADHAHLTRECIELAGKAPSLLRAA
jgi:methylphosphotriester-DNA--protein-cysteine methyltransferase